MAARELVFDIFAVDRASKVFDKVGSEADGLGKKTTGMNKAAGLAFAAVGAAAVKFGLDSVAAYTESETSQAKLTDAYKRFPSLANMNIESLRGINAELGKKTRFDDDATASGQAVLAQFKLTGTQLRDLTPLMQDYAAKTGKTLPEAAEILGKAVLGNGKALKGIGLNLKDTGSAAGNLNQLMGGLRTQVGGFAEKEGTTAAGKTAILKNQFGELQETVGSKLAPAMAKLVDVAMKAVDWISKNSDTVKVFAIGVGVLAGGVGAYNLTIGIASAATKAWSVVTAIASAVTSGWAGVQVLLNAALIANPIGLVIAGIALLIGAIVLIATKTTWFQTAWKVMTDALGAAWQWLWNTILAPIIRFVLNGFASITDGIAKMLDVLSNIPGFGWAKTAADKMAGAADKARALAQGIKDIPDSKTVTVTYFQITKSIQDSQARRLPGFASGTDYAPGGLALINERGGEIVDLPNGSRVIPADKSKSLLGGRSDGATSADIKALGESLGARIEAIAQAQVRTAQTMRRQMGTA